MTIFFSVSENESHIGDCTNLLPGRRHGIPDCREIKSISAFVPGRKSGANLGFAGIKFPEGGERGSVKKWGDGNWAMGIEFNQLGIWSWLFCSHQGW